MTKKILLATALTTVLTATNGAYAEDASRAAFNAAMKDAVICGNVLAETTYEKTKKAESPEVEALSDAIFKPCGTVLVLKDGIKETDPVLQMNPDKIVTVQPMGSSEACFTALNSAVTNAAVALPKEKNASCLSAVEKLKTYKEKSDTTITSKATVEKVDSVKEVTKETVTTTDSKTTPEKVDSGIKVTKETVTTTDSKTTPEKVDSGKEVTKETVETKEVVTTTPPVVDTR